jgi:hypothetical protein
VTFGRLEGRGHESEDPDQGSPEAIIQKWRELKERLWDRKLRLGAGFGELADVQLRLTAEVVRALEGIFGPLNPPFANPRLRQTRAHGREREGG